jgi:two-component system, LytTR family, sensor histidine kinase AlgZ
MHPILNNRRRLQWYLVAWLPIASFVAWLIERSGMLTLLESAAIAYPMAAAYAFVCLSSWYVCRANPLHEATVARATGAVAAAAVLTSAVWVLAGRAWALLLDGLSIFPDLGDRYSGQTAQGGLFFAGILVYFLTAAIHYLLLSIEESQIAEKRALELQVLAREAELRALRAQIDPHFLFNSLNSINALTLQDPAGARRMCLLLADFLRRSLQLGAKEKISFGDELQLAENFLDIEKVRFGERLEVSINVASTCHGCQVPPLIIQPLIENAVTHGIAPLIDGGTLKIEAQRDGSLLEIMLENPFDEDLNKAGTGVGLKNVRERLKNMFGSEGRLDVEQEANLFKVTLRMPCAS